VEKQRLWALLRQIPKGKLTTYKQLAKALDTSPRAIGAILHTNNEPDKIPCYKVVMSNGHIGGYALGKTEKTKRLEREGIRIEKERVINLEKHICCF
jgi:O-6-methylguanine DNA methyltransferase